MIKAMIFDLDGIIIDSEELWFQAAKDLCAEYGHEYTKELYRRVMGSNGAKIIKEELNLKDSEDEITTKFIGNFMSLVEKRSIKTMPGIYSLLERAKKNFILALASSSPSERIDFMIDRFDIRKYFSVILSGKQVANTKPNPDLFLATAEKLELKPEECIVLEDSPNGVKAAKNAGMKCIALKNIFVPDDELKEADILINTLDEIDIEKLLKDFL